MRVGIGFLVAGYVLSQFYRAFLAVLTPVLGQELGATPGDLAVSLGFWYITFGLMQIPVGSALDSIGPRRTVAVLLAIGGGGGAVAFALAQGAWSIHIAMALIGIGCAPVLMGAYYIFARNFAPAVFGTLAGATIGAGSLGNIASAAPLAWLVGAIGWRASLWGVAAATFAVSAALWRFVQDPEPVAHTHRQRGSMLDILRIPGLWLVLPLTVANYAPAAGIRGIWSGPYLAEVHGADAIMIGRVTLVMGLAMVAGNFLYGPADRVFGTMKRAVLVGNAALAVVLTLLFLWPGGGLLQTTVLMAAAGLFGSSFPAIMAHGRVFFPTHLIGRGVSLLNMFSILGVAALQFGSRPIYEFAVARGTPEQAFKALFLFFLVPILVGLAFYAFSRDGAETR